MKKILGIGSPIVDIIEKTNETFLRKNINGDKGGMLNVTSEEISKLEKLLSKNSIKSTGGSVANTIKGLANLNRNKSIELSFLGKIGSDEDGEFYKKEMKDLGIDIKNIIIDSELNTGKCISYVTEDGERTMRTFLGAASALTSEDISKIDFKKFDYVFIEGYLLFNENVFDKILEKSKDTKLIMDLSSFEVVNKFKEKIISNAEKFYLLIANKDEAESLYGYNDLVRTGELLRKAGTKMVALKKGSFGQYVIEETRGFVIFVNAEKTKSLVDTTGAGDLWASGFLFGFINKLSMPKCMRLGSIVAKEVVEVLGSNIPSEGYDRIFKFIKENIYELQN